MRPFGRSQGQIQEKINKKLNLVESLVPHGGSQKSEVKKLIGQTFRLFGMGGLFTPYCTRPLAKGTFALL